MFAVIIPFYQREPGILARTLQSVARQDVADQVVVYVVDDESPVAPGPEVDSVQWGDNFQVRILKKTNGGPASARNYALDRLGDEQYVAFLDSDDAWTDYHLSSAHYAFSNGFDLYTADWALDENITALQRFYGDQLRLRVYGKTEWAHELEDDLVNFTVMGPIGKLSVLVVKRDLIAATRFAESLKTAGEDGLFATELAVKQPKVMVSNRIDVITGKGVNIFTADGWDSKKGVMRSIYFLRSRILMRPLVKEYPHADKNLKEKIRNARRGFWKTAFAAAKKGNLPLTETWRLLRFDPPLLLFAPSTLIGLLIAKWTSRSQSSFGK